MIKPGNGYEMEYVLNECDIHSGQTVWQIAFGSIANYIQSYRKKQFGIKSVGIYSRHQ